MDNIFEEAKALASGKKVIARSKHSSAGCIIKRSGSVISDSVKRKVVEYPKVKKVEKVDRSALDASSVEDFSSPQVRRKELGKFIYNEREQLIRVLVEGYSVSLSSVEELSFTDMLSKFDSCKLEEAKALESLRKSKKEYEERLGAFYKSFKLVSNVVSDINSESTQIEKVERESEDEDEVHTGYINKLSLEERRKKDEAWSARKVELKEKMDTARFEELACKGFTLEQITDILEGNVIKAVDPLLLKKAKERKRRVDSFVEQGLAPVEAERRVKMWEERE